MWILNLIRYKVKNDQDTQPRFHTGYECVGWDSSAWQRDAAKVYKTMHGVERVNTKHYNTKHKEYQRNLAGSRFRKEERR